MSDWMGYPPDRPTPYSSRVGVPDSQAGDAVGLPGLPRTVEEADQQMIDGYVSGRLTPLDQRYAQALARLRSMVADRDRQIASLLLPHR